MAGNVNRRLCECISLFSTHAVHIMTCIVLQFDSVSCKNSTQVCSGILP